MCFVVRKLRLLHVIYIFVAREYSFIDQKEFRSHHIVNDLRNTCAYIAMLHDFYFYEKGVSEKKEKNCTNKTETQCNFNPTTM